MTKTVFLPCIRCGGLEPTVPPPSPRGVSTRSDVGTQRWSCLYVWTRWVKVPYHDARAPRGSFITAVFCTLLFLLPVQRETQMLIHKAFRGTGGF